MKNLRKAIANMLRGLARGVDVPTPCVPDQSIQSKIGDELSPAQAKAILALVEDNFYRRGLL